MRLYSIALEDDACHNITQACMNKGHFLTLLEDMILWIIREMKTRWAKNETVCLWTTYNTIQQPFLARLFILKIVAGRF